MLPVAILAGGLGTRLHPLTERLPKSLLPIAGRPFVFHQLELLRNQDVQRVVLCVGHLGAQIEAAVGDGRAFGLVVEYSYDGESLRGTGGALQAALPVLGSEFFVLYGDSYLPCSFDLVRAAYVKAQRPALMTILRNANRWDRSNVAVRDDGSIEYSRDPTRSDLTYIDFGLSVVSAGVLERYPEAGRLDLSTVWRDLSGTRELAALEVRERFYEIGSRQGIEQTEEFLLEQRRTA